MLNLNLKVSLVAKALIRKFRASDEAATSDVCRTMQSWVIVASSNKTQAHQFRLQSSFALLGFGAVSSSIFIDSNAWYIGVFILISMIIVSLYLNSYYFKEEYAWQAASKEIDGISMKISVIGLNAYISNGGKIKRPDQLFRKFVNENDGLSRLDFTTKMLLAVAVLLGISAGIFTGYKIYESDWFKTKTAATEQRPSPEQRPPELQIPQLKPPKP